MLGKTFHIFRRPLHPDQRLGMALLASVLLHALMWISFSTYSIPGNILTRPVYAPLSIRIAKLPESPKETPTVIKDKRASLLQEPSTPRPVATTAPGNIEPSLSQPGVSVSDSLYLRPISSRVHSPYLASGEFRRSSDVSEKPKVIAMRVPEYPRPAWEQKFSGWVIVMMALDERGKVVDTAALDSSESFSDYAEDISKDMRGSTFAPGKIDGQAVKTLTFVTVRFDYKGLSGREPATDTSAPVSMENDEKR